LVPNSEAKVSLVSPGSSSVAWRGGVGARRLHDVGAEEAGGGGCGVVARSGDKGGDGTLTRGTPA
jgi:hypothetical protein